MSADALSVTIRTCESPSDVRLCIGLQREVWGVSDEDVIPAHIYFVALQTGGRVHLVFDRDRAIAFALAFPAYHGGRRYWHSHMVGVIREYQNRTIGRMLKLQQRGDALQVGVSLIEWTFDPMELRNAYFNIARLGAIVRRYIPDCYGESSSVLHQGLPTDRVVAEWNLNSMRVQSAIASSQPAIGPDAIAIAAPAERSLHLQAELRSRLIEYFARGYAITGFRRADSGNSCYLLEPYEN